MTSLEAVLELRENKRIRNFRETLHFWANEMKKSDPSYEKKIRRDIRKANKELKRIGSYRKIGRWVTYLSLPVTVASLLSGIPAGLILTPIGFSTYIASDLLERKYKWMLMGR